MGVLTFQFAEAAGKTLAQIDARWKGDASGYLTTSGTGGLGVAAWQSSYARFEAGQGGSHQAEAVIRAHPTTDEPAIFLQSSASQVGYRVYVAYSTSVILQRNGAYLASFACSSLDRSAAPYTLKAAFNAAAGSIQVWLQGVSLGTYTDSAPLSGGFPGLGIASNTGTGGATLFESWSDLATNDPATTVLGSGAITQAAGLAAGAASAGAGMSGAIVTAKHSAAGSATAVPSGTTTGAITQQPAASAGSATAAAPASAGITAASSASGTVTAAASAAAAIAGKAATISGSVAATAGAAAAATGLKSSAQVAATAGAIASAGATAKPSTVAAATTARATASGAITAATARIGGAGSVDRYTATADAAQAPARSVALAAGSRVQSFAAAARSSAFTSPHRASDGGRMASPPRSSALSSTARTTQFTSRKAA